MSVGEALRRARAAGDRTAARCKAMRSSIQGALAGGSYGGMDYAGRNVNNLAQHAEQLQHYVGYTYAIVRTIASRIAGQPVRVARLRKRSEVRAVDRAGMWMKHPDPRQMPTTYKDFAGVSEILEEHQLIDAFLEPNPIMVRWTMLFVTVASLEMTGKGYWWIKDPDGKGRTVPEIWPLPAHWVEPEHSDDELYANWKIRPSGMGESFKIPGHEVCYFYYPDPADPMSAMSPLQALARTVLADESVEEAQRRLFTNGIFPGIALVIGRNPETAGIDNNSRAVLSVEQRQQLITLVKQQYRGVINHDEPLILDGLIQDVKKLTTSPREMDFINSSQVTKNRLAQGWGVNTIVLGEIEGANRASAAVADDSFCANVVNPRIELMSQIMTRWLGPKYAMEGEKLLVYIEPAKSNDIDYDLKLEESMIGKGTMGRNEWRKRHGLPPLKIESGDSVFMTNGTEIPIRIDQPSQGGGMTSPGERSKKYGWRNGRRNHSLAKSIGNLEVARIADRMQRGEEDQIRLAVREYLAAKRDEVRRNLGEIAATGQDVNRESLERSADPEKWAEDLREVVKPHLERMALSGAIMEWELHHPRTKREVVAFTKGALSFLAGIPGYVSDKVADWVGYMLGLDQWDDMVEKTLDELGDAVEDGAAEGKSGEELADHAVGKVLDLDRIETRAEAIAAAESVTAVGSGQEISREALFDMGVVVSKRWVSIRDDRTRPTHRQADGQEVLPGQKFIVGGYQCDHPGDPTLPPGERCGCRCLAVGVSN